MLLFPDPRPLVERLGPDFFREAPEVPGVYLMRDGGDTVLYVGKAKNLRKRLGSYRVANPDRMPRRHLRMLRTVTRIELQACPDEASALDRESLLLRTLKPKFNRAGTWPGTPRHLAWRTCPAGLELAVTTSIEPGWFFHGPLGTVAYALRAALVRLIWSALHPLRGVTAMPQLWFQGCLQPALTIPMAGAIVEDFAQVPSLLQHITRGEVEPFKAWIAERTAHQTHPFEIATRLVDLETVTDFAEKCRERVAPETEN